MGIVTGKKRMIPSREHDGEEDPVATVGIKRALMKSEAKAEEIDSTSNFQVPPIPPHYYQLLSLCVTTSRKGLQRSRIRAAYVRGKSIKRCCVHP